MRVSSCRTTWKCGRPVTYSNLWAYFCLFKPNWDFCVMYCTSSVLITNTSQYITEFDMMHMMIWFLVKISFRRISVANVAHKIDDIYTQYRLRHQVGRVLRRHVCSVMRFSLNVTSKSRQASGFAVLELDPTPSRPINGSCVAVVEGDSSPLVALVDRVTVMCSHSTHHASPLEYRVFVNDSVSEDGSSFAWYPVYRGSRTDVTFYPSQLYGVSGVVNVYVQVIDSFGSTQRALHALVHLVISSLSRNAAGFYAVLNQPK